MALALGLGPMAPGAGAGVPVTNRYLLEDMYGHPVTEQNWDGHYVLLVFGYTACPDVCPTTLLDVSRALKLLGEDAEGLQPLFVSVDPARDTADRLRDYVGHFHPRILGLRGSPAQTRVAAENFRVTYGYTVDGRDVPEAPAGRDDYAVVHSPLLYLLSPAGELIAVFGFGTSGETLAEGVRAAMAAR